MARIMYWKPDTPDIIPLVSESMGGEPDHEITSAKQTETSIHISTSNWLANILLTLHHNYLTRQVHMITKAILAGSHSG